ncbi:MAG: DUF6265 family protein [Lysobacteraceae bacterium]
MRSRNAITRTLLAVPFLIFTPLIAASTEGGSVDLSWFSGQWCGGGEQQRIEEHWLPAVGGQLLGLSRTIRDGRVVMFEFLRIDRVDGVPTYFAQPGGRPATAFARVDGGTDADGKAWVRFENLEHDFPQQIEYRRDNDSLAATIAGPGREGKEQRIAFSYRRCD